MMFTTEGRAMATGFNRTQSLRELLWSLSLVELALLIVLALLFFLMRVVTGIFGAVDTLLFCRVRVH
jgi:hypothetical protein